MRDDIAIIGMAGLFPGAPDLGAFWAHVVAGADATGDPPPGSWDPAVFYDPDGAANDRVYCKRGGFLGELARFDPMAHGVMPNALAGSEPDQWLALPSMAAWMLLSRSADSSGCRRWDHELLSGGSACAGMLNRCCMPSFHHMASVWRFQSQMASAVARATR